MLGWLGYLNYNNIDLAGHDSKKLFRKLFWVGIQNRHSNFNDQMLLRRMGGGKVARTRVCLRLVMKNKYLNLLQKLIPWNSCLSNRNVLCHFRLFFKFSFKLNTYLLEETHDHSAGCFWTALTNVSNLSFMFYSLYTDYIEISYPHLKIRTQTPLPPRHRLCASRIHFQWLEISPNGQRKQTVSISMMLEFLNSSIIAEFQGQLPGT